MKLNIIYSSVNWNYQEERFNAIKNYVNGKTDIEIEVFNFALNSKHLEKRLEEGEYVLAFDGVVVNELDLDGNCLSSKYPKQVIQLLSAPIYGCLRSVAETGFHGIIAVDNKDDQRLLKNNFGIDAVLIHVPYYDDFQVKDRGVVIPKVLCMGRYYPPDAAEEFMKTVLPKEFVSLIKEMTKNLLGGNAKDFEDAYRISVEKKGIHYSKEQFFAFMAAHGSTIYEYVNFLLQDKTLRKLAKKGIPVTLVGENWFNFVDSLSVHDRKSVKPNFAKLKLTEVMAEMQHYAVVLNTDVSTMGGLSPLLVGALQTNSKVVTFGNDTLIEEVKQFDNNQIQVFRINEISKMLNALKKEVNKAEKRKAFDSKDYITVDGFIKTIINLFGLQERTAPETFNQRIAYLENLRREKDIYAAVVEADSVLSALERIGNISPSYIYYIAKSKKKAQEELKNQKIKKLAGKNFKVYESLQALEDDLRTHENYYLPRMYYVDNQKGYEKMTKALHKKRLSEKRHVKKPLLTIAIPSYNRGSVCLEAVRRLQELPFDSEIEIVISNNCSNKNTEGYEIIKELKDSRIVYHRTDSNGGYSGNILKILELGRGNFLLMQSDEDLMYVESLRYYLNIILKCTDISIIYSSGIGHESTLYPYDFALDGYANVYGNIETRNYMTGTILNLDNYKKNDNEEIVKAWEDNLYAQTYTHLAVLFQAVNSPILSISSVPLFKDIEHEDPSVFKSDDEGMWKFVQVESRMKQGDGFYRLLSAMPQLYFDEKLLLLDQHIDHIYGMVQVGYIKFHERYREEGYDWQKLCIKIYEESLKFVQKYDELTDPAVYERVMKFLNDLYDKFKQSQVELYIANQEKEA